jgi:heme-degrading monooxygenase HmoA
VIARIWHGRTRAADAASYRAYVERTGIPDYRATPGNRGAWVLTRVEGDVAHFLTLSFWDSLEAVRAFAGENVERARYYEEDKKYLLEFEPEVTHYEVSGG